MLGYVEEELLSMSITDIHPPEETATTLERIGERAGGTLREHRDVVMLRKDGTAFPADVMGNPLRYGGRLCVLGLFRDVTQRRQAQKAAERERQTLKHLLESSDRERQLIAYEIHDGLAQQLAGAIMQLQAYEHLKDTDPDGAAKALDAGMTMLRRGHFEARRLISGVRPLILDEEGIVAAVAHLVNERRQQGYRSPSKAKSPSADWFRSWRMPSTASSRKRSPTPASTAAARKSRWNCGNSAMSCASASRTGDWASTRPASAKTVSG